MGFLRLCTGIPSSLAIFQLISWSEHLVSSKAFMICLLSAHLRTIVITGRVLQTGFSCLVLFVSCFSWGELPHFQELLHIIGKGMGCGSSCPFKNPPPPHSPNTVAPLLVPDPLPLPRRLSGFWWLVWEGVLHRLPSFA